MDELAGRWQRAAQHADEEQVRVVEIGGELFATSSSRPLTAYRLRQTPRGWSCECIANGEHLLPCKHLAALADALNLDVVADMYVELPEPAGATPAD